MKNRLFSKPILSCTLVFLICSVARIVEYFFIRTDETVLAENFLHKVFGIVVLAVVLAMTKLSWNNIGFTKTKVLKNTLKGLALGASCFTVAYLAECIMLYYMNGNVKLSVYTSGFSLSGEAVTQNGIGFILLCIGFNLINVWMEEGLFRGFYITYLKEKFSPKAALFIAALFFGLWHLVTPLRSVLDGEMTLPSFAVMSIGYVVLSGLMGIKWGLLYEHSGSVWIGLADHFFNNCIVTNLLHVVTGTGTDEMQILRVLIGELTSFAAVVIYFRLKDKKTMALAA
jgi:membrane protease YdiL (CAAX protease family)